VGQWQSNGVTVILSRENALTRRVIGLAIEVHRYLGPGLLESAYEECLCFELKRGSISFARQVPLRVEYKGAKIDCSYRADLIVGEAVLLELKAVDRLTPLHQAQLLTYLRLSRLKVGLLMNFNAVVLRDGLRRFVL